MSGRWVGESAGSPGDGSACIVDWAFAATGVVHALPLLVDARTADATDSDQDASYEFRDLHDATSEDHS